MTAPSEAHVTASSEKEKMLSGALYDASDPELTRLRVKARRLLHAFNHTDPDDGDERARLLGELLGSAGDGAWIEPPFFCDYGSQIFLGRGVFMNFNCVILDCNTVRIGDRTQLGPNVTIAAAKHPIDAAERVKGPELAEPVTLGRRVWIGAAAVIGPGVTIGDDSTVGAGSVVTKDVPPRVVAAGNPCRVIRSLES